MTKTITRMKDIENGNLCDYCKGTIAECCSFCEFNLANPASDNIIACDQFHGDFESEIMTQEKIVVQN